MAAKFSVKLMAETGAVAVWCVARDQTASAAAFEAHFNYWRLHNSKPPQNKDVRPDFLEVGLMLDQPSSLSEVNLFIPIAISKTHVRDLGALFSDQQISQGIFNQPLNILQEQNSRITTIELQKDQQFVGVYRFDSDDIFNELEYVQISGGTVLRIGERVLSAFKSAAPKVRAYFRIRIMMPSQGNPFVRVIKPEDQLFLSGIEQTEFVDFRCNDPRTLPENVERLMRSELTTPRVKLTKIAFLIAVPLEADVTLSHAAVHRTRRLETKVWGKYVPGGIPDDMLVYHWRALADVPRRRGAPTEGVGDFSAFAKLKVRRSGMPIWLPYVALAFLIGVLGNLSAELLEVLWNTASPMVNPILKLSVLWPFK